MTSLLTEIEDELKKGEALCEKATPGPWHSSRATRPVDGEYDYAIADARHQILAETFGRSSKDVRPPAG